MRFFFEVSSNAFSDSKISVFLIGSIDSMVLKLDLVIDWILKVNLKTLFGLIN